MSERPAGRDWKGSSLSNLRVRVAALATGAVGVALLALVGPLAGSAAAHATLQQTTPVAESVLQRAPRHVELQFDEPVDSPGGIRVLDPKGERADLGRVDRVNGGLTLRVPLEGDESGTYTVAWRVLSDDGHDITGTFLFHVRTKTGAAVASTPSAATADVVGAVGRVLTFGGALAVVGAGLVAALAGRDEPRVRDRLRRVTVIAGLIGCVGVSAALLAQVASSSERNVFAAFSLVPEVVRDTRTGHLALIRFLLLTAAASAAAVAALWRKVPWLPGVLTVGSMATLSLAGHAWTSSARTGAVAADIGHLVVVGIWIGGLVSLVAVLDIAYDRVKLGQRFSAVALAAASIAAVTGAISGWLQIRSFEGLTSTTYGRLLIAKLVLFAVLLWLGWVNRAHLVPLLVRSTAPLRRALRAEIVIAVLVLSVTALLVDQPPARTEIGGPFSTSAINDVARLQVTVDPARIGLNDMHFYFFDTRGLSPLDVDAVTASVAIGDLPARKVTVLPITPSHVSVTGAAFTAPGRWTVTVTALRQGAPTTFTFEVPIT